MKKLFSFLALLAILSVGIYSCTLEELPTSAVGLKLNLPDSPFDYSNMAFPNHFQAKMASDNMPETNRANDHSATLGRVLFYDTRLSINNKVACASCHFQQNAFSDVKALSEGFEGAKTGRNSLPIFNNRFMQTFFWDSETDNLEEQVVMPVKDHIEMGLEDAEHLVAKLEKTDFYGELFENAYGTSEVTMDKIQKSMAQFIRSIVSTSSKYDQGYKNNFADFNHMEKEGLSLFFKAQCNTCHNLENNIEVLTQAFGESALFNFNNFNPNFFGEFGNSPDDLVFDEFGRRVPFSSEQANIGLEKNYTDKGIGALTGNSVDNGKFKIPSIRNIMLTAPYMHDGRFANIDEVLDHYNNSLIDHDNLDQRLKVGSNGYDDADPTGTPGDPIKFDFSEEDKKALKAFFNTLTDNTLTTDPKYSNPFN